MPFHYLLPSSSPELRQGEILCDFYDYRPENPVGNHRENTPIPVVPIFHKRVIVVTQDCDLMSDYREREAQRLEHRNILGCVIVCDVFEESDIRDPALFGTKDWRKVKQNQDERYHCFPPAVIGEDSAGPQVPEIYLDFKRISAPCTSDLYEAIKVAQTKRLALVPAFYIHDLIHRFYAFHGRVALPEA